VRRAAHHAQRHAPLACAPHRMHAAAAPPVSPRTGLGCTDGRASAPAAASLAPATGAPIHRATAHPPRQALAAAQTHHRPGRRHAGLDAAQEQALHARLQAAGAVVSTYLPPATWLLLAPPGLADSRQAHAPHQLLPLLPEHKASPELSELLELLQHDAHRAQLLDGTPVHQLPPHQAQQVAWRAAQQAAAWGADPPQAATRRRTLLGRPHIMRPAADTHAPTNASAPGWAPARMMVLVHFPRVHKSDLAAGSAGSFHPAEAAAADWAQALAALSARPACAPQLHVQRGQLAASACPEVGIQPSVAGQAAAVQHHSCRRTCDVE